MNRIIIIVIGLIVLAVSAVFLFSDNDSSTSTGNVAAQKNEFSELVIGNPDAEITIVEYSDFKCPECGKHHQDVGKQIRNDYIDTGKAKIVFRPFPVYSQDGAKALLGSYCAQDQGKFVEYHDALFSHMWDNYFKDGDYQKAIDPVLTDDVLESINSGVGIEQSTFDNCINDVNTNNAYLKDINLAAPDDIQGTPTFVIGGQKIVGPQNYNVFKTLLEIQ